MKHIKTTLITAGMAALLTLSVVTQAASSREIDQELTVLQGGQVRFKVIDGDVVFRSWNKNSVRVRGSLGKSNNELVFKNDGADTIIQVESKGHRFYSDSDTKQRGRSDVDLEIFMPASSLLVAQTTSGDVNIDGLQAGIKAKNISGDISISNSSKSIEAYSSSGDISLQNCIGEIHVETVSGDVDAELQADRFEASTISGDIQAKIGKVSRAEISSVSGDLIAEMELAPHASVQASTVSGDIELIFDQRSVNAHFDLTTGPVGDIENNLTKDQAIESWVESETLQFKVGNGQSMVEAETVSGEISVRKR